jgi:hypothetical protein
MSLALRRTLCLLLCGLSFAIGSKAQTADNNGPQATKTYPDSLAGIQDQYADILQVVRAGDETAIHKALDTLGIPDANGWIAAHFSPQSVSQEQEAYQVGLKKFQSHIWWVAGNFGKDPKFSIQVEESELARPLSEVGFEGLIPRPKDAVRIENFRFDSMTTDPKLGKPSWVNSFIYLEGRFRLIGGTYPFWAESLTATRGPMSLPAEMINGRTIQAEAFRHDLKGPGIDAIVHIKIEVGHDGKIKKMKVLSGDPEFVPDAKRYLNDAEYPQLPNDPRFANAQMVWDMEVVFFTPKPPPPTNP